MLKTMKPKHGATRLLFSMLSIMAGVVLIKAIFIGSFFWLMTLELEAENVAGPAPEGDYKIRRMWGEENLGPYLKSAEKWIRRNKEIEQAVGKVYVVAPTGAPNTHGVSFGESWTKLKLQVVGPKGEGTLKLKEYNWDGRSGNADWQQKHWSFRPGKARTNNIREDLAAEPGLLPLDSCQDEIIDHSKAQ